MKPDLPLIVVDTSVLLAIFLNEQMEGRVDRAAAVLRAHGKSHNIAIPALQELELLAPDRLRKDRLDERQKHYEKAETFIRSQQFISLELNQFVARQAGLNYGQVGDKRNDVALVAAAIFYRATALYTFDKKLIDSVKASPLGMRVQEPPAAQAVLFEV
ncbi:type II toxin-antitoxin system VapC family toxin [Streptomyces sp. NPDC127092]|uniref:type II toxin-antitoxin system VapC family toxin n=1 Tax=Streptomyces sp. NPDC127092 TaxID=3347135 RepID=UPI00366A2DDB|nr:type II toxin-antitoxin system VapC family toxin [Micrococcus luteus]